MLGVLFYLASSIRKTHFVLPLNEYINAMLDPDDTSEHIRPIVITPHISPRGTYTTSRRPVWCQTLPAQY